MTKARGEVPPDAAWLIVLYLILMLAIPARLVLPGMGGAGRPSVAFGLGLLLWWLLTHLLPAITPRGRQPIRTLLLVYTGTVLASYVLALDRGLAPLEDRSAARYLIVLASWTGVALVAADGIRNRRSLHRVLNWWVGLTAFSAVIGVLQFYGIDLAGRLRPPGLVYNLDLVGLRLRGGPGFNRVYGTMQHYIEFGTVLAMVLPLAVHLALLEGRRRVRRVRWGIVALLAAAIPFSISRAGVVGLAVGFVVLSAAWPRRRRAKALLVAVVGIAAFRGIVPGILGTIRSLFTNLNNDPSILNRRSDYAAVDSYIGDRPLLGRGPGTFVPEIYRVLDNQFLGSLLEIGYIGTAVLMGVFIFSYLLARQIRRHAHRSSDGHLAQALAAGVAAAFVTSFTFDSLAFPTFAGCLFVLVGLTGALKRITEAPDPDLSQDCADLLGTPWDLARWLRIVPPRRYGSALRVPSHLAESRT